MPMLVMEEGDTEDIIATAGPTTYVQHVALTGIPGLTLLQDEHLKPGQAGHYRRVAVMCPLCVTRCINGISHARNTATLESPKQGSDLRSRWHSLLCGLRMPGDSPQQGITSPLRHRLRRSRSTCEAKAGLASDRPWAIEFHRLVMGLVRKQCSNPDVKASSRLTTVSGCVDMCSPGLQLLYPQVRQNHLVSCHVIHASDAVATNMPCNTFHVCPYA